MICWVGFWLVDPWNVFGSRLGEGAGRNSVDIQIQILQSYRTVRIGVILEPFRSRSSRDGFFGGSNTHQVYGCQGYVTKSFTKLYVHFPDRLPVANSSSHTELVRSEFRDPSFH